LLRVLDNNIARVGIGYYQLIIAGEGTNERKLCGLVKQVQTSNDSIDFSVRICLFHGRRFVSHVVL
jgi:hypothetical protein